MLNLTVRTLKQFQQECRKTCNTYKNRRHCNGCNIEMLIEELPKYMLVKNPSCDLEL